MRILFRILLFPVALLLSIITVILRFVSCFSGALLSILSAFLFIVALLTLILLKQPGGALTALIFAFAVSPFGVPLLMEGLVNILDGVNGAIKSI